MKDKCAFFTIADDRYYYPVGTTILINSFKKFHPDIDLIVFRQDIINKIFADKHVNFYNCRPTFAKLLLPHYDRVVGIDADTIVLGKLDAIIDGSYDVLAPTNFNDYENMSIENVTEQMFVQAGLVASGNAKFWEIWEMANKKAMQYVAQENTVLNLIWYNDPNLAKMKKVIIDKDKDYYGCKSLNREKEFVFKDGKVMCRGEQVFLYHAAKGGANMPKFNFDKMGFNTEVAEYMKYLGYLGTTARYGAI